MSPTLIHYNLDHSSLHSCLFVMVHFSLEKPVSHHLTSIYIIIKVKYIFIVVLKLLLYIPVEGKKKLSIIAQYLCTISFDFSLSVFTHFQNYFSGHPFLPSTSGTLFHTLVIQLDYFVSRCIPSRYPF